MKLAAVFSPFREPRTKRSAIVAVAAAVVGIVAVWLATLSLIAEKRNSLTDGDREISGRICSSVNSEIHQQFKVIEVFLKGVDNVSVRNPQLDLRFDENFGRQIASLQEAVQNQIEIRLYDQDGGVFFPPANSDQPMGNTAQRDFFIAAANPGQKGIFIGTPFLSPITHRWLIPVSLPLRAKPHGVIAIAAVMPVANLVGLFDAARGKPNGSITLFRSDGTLMARAPAVEKLYGTKVATAGSATELSRTIPRGSLLRMGDIDGRMRQLSYAKMDDFQMLTVVTSDLDDVLMPAREYAFYAILVAITLTLGMISMSALALGHLRLTNQIHAQLSSEAGTDALTGVANRRRLMEFGNTEFSRSKRYGRPLSALMLDLDHFKKVNDRHGHQVGDEILRQTALVIQSELRGTDLLGRYGGEEFIVFMPETATEEAVNLAERIRAGVTLIEVRADAETVGTKVSVGIATLLPDEANIESLIHRADEALYAAKRAGRNRVVAFVGQ